MRSGMPPGAVALFWILSPAAGPWSLRPSARAARRASSKSIRPIATSLSSAGRTTRASEQPTAATVPNSTTLRAKFGHRKVTQMRRTSGARSRRKTANDGGQGLTDRGVPTGAGSAGGPVGYARPPMASRFKPGKSGNPKGRPRNSRNLKTIIQGALTAPVVLREGARKRSISKLDRAEAGRERAERQREGGARDPQNGGPGRVVGCARGRSGDADPKRQRTRDGQ